MTVDGDLVPWVSALRDWVRCCEAAGATNVPNMNIRWISTNGRLSVVFTLVLGLHVDVVSKFPSASSVRFSVMVPGEDAVIVGNSTVIPRSWFREKADGFLQIYDKGSAACDKLLCASILPFRCADWVEDLSASGSLSSSPPFILSHDARSRYPKQWGRAVRRLRLQLLLSQGIADLLVPASILRQLSKHLDSMTQALLMLYVITGIVRMYRC